jgi:hypothetical protein
MLTIAPPPAFSRAGTAYFIPRNTPLALTLIRRSHAETLSMSGSKVPLMPALFTRMSSLPNAETADATASCHDFSSVTSSLTKRA